MGKVVCIGAVNVDTILYVEDFCKGESEEIIRDKRVFSGGQAGNIAAGLGKLGKDVFFVGNIGNDEHASMLMKDFDKCGVDYSLARRTDINNSVYSLVDKTGSRRMYAYNNTELDMGDFPEEIYEDTSFIVFTSLIGDGVIDLYVDIAKRAKANGIKIVLDPGNIFARLGFEKLEPLLGLCDYFFPSVEEVNLLVGSVDNISKISDLVPNVIVTCGKKGVKFFKNNGEEFALSSKDCVDIKDTTGAGDCFLAAFISMLVDGKLEGEALSFANSAAALSILKRGARAMSEHECIIDLMNGRV
jgi:sugar/nucleoside kinase (ribokinase family)